MQRITIDPAMMGGAPCIRGMRVTVNMIVGQIRAGRTVDELLADYPICKGLQSKFTGLAISGSAGSHQMQLTDAPGSH